MKTQPRSESELRDLVTNLVRNAGEAALTYWCTGTDTQFEKSVEGQTDFYSLADKASEAVLMEGIRIAFPNHTILSEESTEIY